MSRVSEHGIYKFEVDPAEENKKRAGISLHRAITAPTAKWNDLHDGNMWKFYKKMLYCL